MSEPSLEALYEQFRRRGDPAALAEVFDRTAPELLRVAHHLAGGLAEAEDLVQETFVVAIERARRFDARRGLLPWLLGILAKRALKARGRRGAHPPRPERMSAREVADPSEELERAELRRALEAGIAGLEQPYREVLAKHLVDGRRAVEIARELGRAPGTVRMQLMRGLEQLRRALPAGVVAGSAVLAPGARGLAAVRAEVLAKAAQVGAAPAGPLGGTVATIGGVLVSTKAVVGIVGAAGALALVWIAWGPGRGVRAEPDLRVAVTSGIDAPRREPGALGRGETAAPHARDKQRTALAAASVGATARNWKIVGEVRGLEPGLRPLGVILSVSGHREVHAIAEPDPAGRFELDLSRHLADLPVGYYSIGLNAFGMDYRQTSTKLVIEPEDFRLAAAGPHEHEVELEVTPWLFLTGRVVTESGAPARGGWVELLAGDPRESVGSSGAHDGSFKLRILARGEALLLYGDGHHAPSTRAIELPDGGELELAPLVLVERGAELRGRVELPRLLADSGVTVEARRFFGDAEPPEPNRYGAYPEEDRFQLAVQKSRAQPDGRFVLGGLVPGTEYELTIARLHGFVHAASLPPLRVTAPDEDLLLGPALGAIAVEVWIGDQRDEWTEPGGDTRAALHHGTGWESTQVDRQGRTAFLVHREQDCRVRVEKPGYETFEVELPAATRGLECERRVVLEPASPHRTRLVLEPETPDGEPLNAIRLELRPPPDGEGPLEVRLQDGEFVVEGLAPGRYEARVEPVDIGGVNHCASYLRAEPFEVKLAADEELRRRLHFELGGRIEVVADGWEGPSRKAALELLDADGARLEARTSVRTIMEGEIETWTHSAGVLWLPGSAELFPTLAPGRYEIRLDDPDLVTPPVWCEVEAGQTVEVTLPVAAR